MIPRNVLITIVVLFCGVVSLAFYALHLKHEAELLQPVSSELKAISPPVTGTDETVPIFFADDDHQILHKRLVTLSLPPQPAERTREILRSLITVYQEKNSLHRLGPDADIDDVFIVGTDTMVIDSNAAFADQHQSGILVEELTLASVARTIAANVPGITRMKLLIDGKERETLAGHADIADFYVLGSDDWPVTDQ